MSKDKPTTSGAKRSSWKKKVAVGGGGLLLLVVILYFVVSSSFFIKSVVLPRVGGALNADLQADQVSLSPFSRLMIKGLKLQVSGDQPLLSAEQVLVRYNLWSILGGTMKVDEIQLGSPTILIVQQPDGTTSLDSLLKKEPETETSSKPAPGSSEPLQIDLTTLQLNNASVKLVTLQADGGREEKAVENLNLILRNIKNGSTGSLELDTGLKLDSRQPAAQTNALVEAQLSGKYSIGLGPDLMPTSLSGTTQLTVNKVEGWMSELAQVEASLNVDITPQEIKEVLLSFKRQQASLGQLRVTGPFDMAAMEGDVALELRSLNRQVLNLALGGSGLVFGPQTAVNITNQIQITQSGQRLKVVGEVRVDQATVALQQAKTPVLDLLLDYDLVVDQTQENGVITVSSLNLRGNQNQLPFLSGGLTSPMTLSLAENNQAGADSKLALNVTNLSLADWRPFLADYDPAGQVNLGLTVDAKQSAQQIQMNLDVALKDLSLKLDTNPVQIASVELRFTGGLDGFEKLDITEGRLAVRDASEPVMTADVSGQYHLGTGAADLKMKVDAGLTGLLRFMPQPGTQFSQGTLMLGGTLAGDGKQNQFSGQVALHRLKGNYGDYLFDDYSADFDLALQLADSLIDITKGDLTLSQQNQNGGNIRMAGQYDLAKSKGNLRLDLNSLNQHALRPFLQPMLSGQTLVRASLSGTNAASIDMAGPIHIQSLIQLTDLVVDDPEHRLKDTPLEVTLQLDAGMAAQRLDLTDTRVKLKPTSRALNELQLKGWLDFSDTNTLQGDLKLTSTGLDLDRYYDLFMAPSGDSTKTGEPDVAPAPESTSPPVEPEPMKLPVSNFLFDSQIDRLFLKEIDVENFHVTTKINDDTILVDPLALILNGKPVTGRTDLNLGVNGWEYDVRVNVDSIPLLPLINSFAPELKDKVKGQLFADTQLKGAGITDRNLKKNLAGHFSLSVTNADLKVMPPSLRTIIFPVMALLRLNELTGSPLHLVDVRATVQEGIIQLGQAKAVSDAFAVTLTGQIPMADPLTNSPLNQVPLEFALSRAVAKKSNLIPSGAPEDTPYVAMPEFVTLGGTIGALKVKLDKLKIAGMLAKSTAGLGNLVGDKTGETLNDLGNLLTGFGQSKTNKTATTNATGQVTTNEPPKLKPLDLLNRFRK